MEALPSRVVTFAFTDIEGSTARWERDRAGMQEAVRRHDAIVSRAIKQCGGHVFKTIATHFSVLSRGPKTPSQQCSPRNGS